MWRISAHCDNLIAILTLFDKVSETDASNRSGSLPALVVAHRALRHPPSVRAIELALEPRVVNTWVAILDSLSSFPAIPGSALSQRATIQPTA